MKVLFGCLVLAISVSPKVAGTPCKSVNEVAWMSGTWQQRTVNATTVESWQRLSPEIISGTVRTTTTDGRPGFSESMLVAQMEGQVFYITKVKENPRPVAFKAESCSDNKVSFINPEHDFPTKLVYERSQSAMTVTVTGSDNKGFTVEYTLRNE